MNALSRDDFREGVFDRDNHKCVVCGMPAKDAHHILERRLFEDGGYHIDNGVSLCEQHHIEAEKTILGCDELREFAKIQKKVMPNHLDKGINYDKWGNIILTNGRRVIGELFYDESVQKILAGVLDQFCPYVKYPKTNHLPWSPGYTSDDRVFTQAQFLECFMGKEAVVTEKLDGENTSMYRDYIHARSIDGRNHVSRSWVKNLHATISYNIPDGWRICGENVYAKHSIQYSNLDSYFYTFAIYDEKNTCLSWDDIKDYSSMLGLETVPELYRGVVDENFKELVEGLYSGKSVFDGSDQEGYVMRLTDAFHFGNHAKSMAKYVRESHVTTGHNWMNQAVVANKLKEE